MPTPDNSLGSVEFLMRVGSAFSACLQLSTSTSKLPFLVFLAAFRVALVEITFYEERQEFGKADLLQRFNKNLGKSAASFSKSDSDRFHLIFFIWRHHICCIFFAGPALHHPPWSPTCVGNELRGETYLPWLRWGYATSILKLRVGFRAVTNFKFSALVKFLLSQCNWPSAPADKGWELPASADLKVQSG